MLKFRELVDESLVGPLCCKMLLDKLSFNALRLLLGMAVRFVKPAVEKLKLAPTDELSLLFSSEATTADV